ncbi:lectin C-type domain protein [Ancylostoma duodenale]|uniref:Lectin C-type domain protein n=1 Tax=Ancylostoma duodenale TaxID=51022 RepID=A0A0C2FR02_9BILA|nr:lectin C-type domain protein [Ancylostoma duodenale]
MEAIYLFLMMIAVSKAAPCNVCYGTGMRERKWMRFADCEYKFCCTEMVSFKEAERRCNSYDAHLVSIHSEKENAFVRGKLRRKWQLGSAKTLFINVLELIDHGKYGSTWIGLARAPSKCNRWSWTDGSEMEFEKWYYGRGGGRPKGNGKLCAVISIRDGTVNDTRQGVDSSPLS